MRTGDIFIAALGTVLPPLRPTPHPRPDAMVSAPVAGDTAAVELALSAARQAIERWGGDTDDIALLLYADSYHTGPDGWCPHAYLQRHLVGGQAFGIGLRQGCNGVFGGLELAATYLRCLPPDKHALLVAADNFDSPQIDRWTALDGYCMADGAGALVLGRRGGFARLNSVTSTAVPELEDLHRGTEPLHPAGVVAGRRLDFQARMAEAYGGAALPAHLAALWIKALQETAFRALDETGITLLGVRRVALPHAPLAALEVNLHTLGLTRAQATWEYDRTVGHSVNDHLFTVAHLLDERALDPGDRVLLVGIGPGVTFAAAVVEIVDYPSWDRPGEQP